MKSTLALVAMAAATANASVSDAVFANAMAFAKDTRMHFDANNGRRVLASAPSPSGDVAKNYIKGECVKGQTTQGMDFGGIDLLIPATGYCMNVDTKSSLLLTCDGVTMNSQSHDVIDCKGKDITKVNQTAANKWACAKGEVVGVKLSAYAKSDCSDYTGYFVFANDFCMPDDKEPTKVSCAGDKVTFAEYAKGDSKCAAKAKNTITFLGGDDKCHSEESAIASLAPSASSASSVALTAGIAFAGLIASLALM